MKVESQAISSSSMTNCCHSRLLEFVILKVLGLLTRQSEYRMSLLETVLPKGSLGDLRHVLCRGTVFFSFGERADARCVASDLFGSAITIRHFAGLAGAPRGADVEVGVCQGQLTIEISDPRHQVYRGILRVFRTGGVLVLCIEALHIHRPALRGHGLGLGIFARQLETARRLGVMRIETRAGRRRNENGYYSWPRYGFEGSLPEWLTSSRLPRELRRSQSVLDIMASETGRRWWLAHGVELDLSFDVRADSRSQQTFSRYRLSRKEQMSTTRWIF